ncbi:MAG: hypothetical protein M1814_002637 [Vezdaea aestivalis]|nr:MAG: hypothetical protein M1814_002637 [Vezdaea aestivalis]
MEKVFQMPPPATSKVCLFIGGVHVYIYGLQELKPGIKSLTCLWLLHPRQQTYECMTPLAHHIIHKCTENSQGEGRGLIAASFDLRNHGERLIDAVANESWKTRDPNHAQNMFSIIQGSTLDMKMLVENLATYLAPYSVPSVLAHMVLGVSLGGHVAWQCLANIPEIQVGIPIIGCCDFAALMQDRAVKSGLALVSPEKNHLPPFPLELKNLITKYDVAASMRFHVYGPNFLWLASPALNGLSDQERLLLCTALGRFRHKVIFNVSGQLDHLVPRHCSDWPISCLGALRLWGLPFLFIDAEFPGAGHEVTFRMAEFVASVVSFAILEYNDLGHLSFANSRSTVEDRSGNRAGLSGNSGIQGLLTRLHISLGPKGFANITNFKGFADDMEAALV